MDEQPLARRRAPPWVKSASWAVVKTSGSPPAAGQSSPSGTGMSWRSWTTRELGLAAAADDRHDAVALGEALGARARARRPRRPAPGPGCPAARRAAPGSRPALQHVGAVEPGGADADEHLAGPGLGIGVLGDDDSPSRMVAARMARQSRGGSGGDAAAWGGPPGRAATQFLDRYAQSVSLPIEGYRLEEISPRAYQHPADRAATAALQKVPYLDEVVRKLIALGYERALRAASLGSAVRLGQTSCRTSGSCIARSSTPSTSTTGPRPVRDAVPAGQRGDDRLREADRRPQLGARAPARRRRPARGPRPRGGHILSDHVLYQTALLILLRLGARRACRSSPGCRSWPSRWRCWSGSARPS